MKYTRVHIDAFGYELPPVVVTTSELEDRLAPMYEALRISKGQLELITGISERRWWTPGYPVSRGAIAAGRKALTAATVRPEDIGMLVYGSVCREHFEPATACRVAAGLGIGGRATVYDITNACLAAVNGLVDIANRIELGQIRAGMVVACETAREINEAMIDRMLEKPDMEVFTKSLATLTGGSGAVAVIATDGSFSSPKRRKLLGGAARAAPEHHDLCVWGLQPNGTQPSGRNVAQPPPAVAAAPSRMRTFTPFTRTDSAAVLKHGVELGAATWRDFLDTMQWRTEDVDKIICHQVGSGHQETILKSIGVPAEKDFPTYPFLGNIGTVSLPLSAAIAEEREFLRAGDRVAFLGIGSGLNCLMLGLEW